MNSILTGSADELGVSIADISSFYEKHWPRKMCLSLPRFATWQFVSPPEQFGKCSVCVSVEGSKVIGLMGLHQRTFRLAGSEYRAAELTTWIVSPDAKGRGVGPRMLDYLQAEYEVLLGSGISDEALSVYLRKGFNYWRSIPRYFRVWDIEAVRPYSRIDSLGEKLAKHRIGKVVPNAHGAQRTKAECIVFPDQSSDKLNSYLRDARHLAWRYDQHPVFSYETYAIDEKSFVVLRRDEIQGMRFAHVLELASPVSHLRKVIEFLDFYAREHALAAMDFTCTSSAIGGNFIASGWFSSVDEPMFAFINLFHPPELREPQTTSLIYWAKDCQPTLADLGKLHLVKGDLDLDRPTMHFYETKSIPTK
jgi:hypothetical protein